MTTNYAAKNYLLNLYKKQLLLKHLQLKILKPMNSFLDLNVKSLFCDVGEFWKSKKSPAEGKDMRGIKISVVLIESSGKMGVDPFIEMFKRPNEKKCG